jgi:hypothetical protein
MADDLAAVFDVLKAVLVKFETSMAVKVNSDVEYTLVTRSASPFKQHKGQPLYFGSVRLGKSYVSFHLMPIYMCPELAKMISPPLKKRMQGKSCFNFKNDPGSETVAELTTLTEAGFRRWSDLSWL